MLSMKAKYAIKSLITIARNGRMMQTKNISETAGIPQKFLEAILLELKHRNIVDSKRGAMGGYFLLKPPSEIMIGDLIRYIDGPLAPIKCASVTAYQKCDDCKSEDLCEIRRVMVDVRNAIAGILDNRSIEDLINFACSNVGIDGSSYSGTDSDIVDFSGTTSEFKNINKIA